MHYTSDFYLKWNAIQQRAIYRVIFTPNCKAFSRTHTVLNECLNAPNCAKWNVKPLGCRKIFYFRNDSVEQQ